MRIRSRVSRASHAIPASSIQAGRAWARYWDTQSIRDLERAQALEDRAFQERMAKNPESALDPFRYASLRRN